MWLGRLLLTRSRGGRALRLMLFARNGYNAITLKQLAIVLCCLRAWLALAWAAPLEPATRDEPATIKHVAPGARVSAIASDRRRFLWFGMGEGLVRYDGFTLEPLRGPNMPTSAITALFAATDGSLWVGTRGSRALSRLQEGALAAVTIALPKSASQVFAFAARGDEMFVGTNQGLFQVGRDLLAEPVSLGALTSGDVTALLVARDKSLWVGHQRGLMRVVANRISLISGESLPLALAQDGQGRIWMGRQGAPEAFVFDESGHELAHWRSHPTKALLAGADGNVWMATEQGVRRAAGVRSPSDVELGLDFDGRMQALALDAEGTLWAGTATHGAVQIDTHPALRLLPATQAAFGFSVTEDVHKGIWLSTTSSILRFKDGQQTTLLHGQTTGLPFDVRAISPARDGGIWAASAEQGAFHVTGALGAGGEPGPPWNVERLHTPAVRTIFDDQSGTVWFGWEHGGLSRASNGGPPTPVPLGSDLKIIAIQAAKGGGLWLAAWNHGLVRLFDDGRTRTFDTGTGGVFSVAELPNGVVCFGATSGGLHCLSGEVDFHYGADEGVTDEIVGSIVVDRFGAVWLGTTNGILRLEELPQANRKYISTQRLGLSAGLRSVECTHGYANGGVALSDGTLVFSTTHAAAVVDPQRLAAQAAPSVVLDQMLLNGEAKPIVSGEMAFPVGGGNLEVRYAAPRFTGTEALQFYYMLEGQDKDWVKAGARRVAIYTNLPARAYRFLVKTEERIVQRPAVLSFRLVPPFHRTRTFAILMFCAATAALLLLLRFLKRQRRLRRADILSERRRMARDLHDTVEQRVFAVRLQLDTAIQELAAASPSASAASARVERAVGLLGEASIEMRSAIHALRAPDMEARDLPLEISKTAARVFRGSDIKFHLNASPALPSLAMDQHQQVLSIVSEALTNALKHGAAKNLHVTLTSADGTLVVKVRDDGTGFDTNAPAPFAHYGLTGMRERAQSIGATLTVSAAPGSGTEVTVALPQAGRKGRVASL